MSLRCVGRVIYQTGMRAVLGMKEQASKCDPNLKSLRDSAYSSSSSTPARRFSGALDSAVKTAEERLKQSEESLRTVMYLSCWGPN